jgi:hypothetical protein
MDSTRRGFFAVFMSGAAVAGAGLLAASFVRANAFQDVRVPQQQASVPPPPPSRPLLPSPVLPPTSAQLRQNQRDIRKDVDQLFSLAQELKTLSSKSDAAQELPVALIQKTEEIEKLAKKIRDLARD